MRANDTAVPVSILMLSLMAVRTNCGAADESAGALWTLAGKRCPWGRPGALVVSDRPVEGCGDVAAGGPETGAGVYCAGEPGGPAEWSR